jgi:hypothetical protein
VRDAPQRHRAQAAIFRERDVPRMLSLATARAEGDSSVPDELRNYPARSRQGKALRLAQ